jgi:hypothetical protein
MNLARDLLDKRVLDRDKHVTGRVDEVMLQLTDGEPPRVVYIEMGAVPLLRRLGRVGRWLALHVIPVDRDPHAGPRQPFRVAWDDIRQLEHEDVVADLDAETSRAHAWERWLAEHVVRHIPGA